MVNSEVHLLIPASISHPQECPTGSVVHVHLNVDLLPEDNGESFFAAYFHEQQKKNATMALHPLNNRCQCKKCMNNPVQLPEATAQPPQAIRMMVQQPKKKKVSKKGRQEPKSTSWLLLP